MTSRAPSVGDGICRDTVSKGGGSRGGISQGKGSMGSDNKGRGGLPPRDAQIAMINAGSSRS